MLARMEISTWRTDAGDVDILADMPDRDGRHLRFEELLERADSAVVAGLVVRVASLDDIIASKAWAGRPKDREALPELRRLRAMQDRDQESPPPEPAPPPS
jgi:predicted nucleotidyltransferase